MNLGLGSDAGAYLVYHGQAIQDEREYILDALKDVMDESAVDWMLAESERWIRERFRR